MRVPLDRMRQLRYLGPMTNTDARPYMVAYSQTHLRETVERIVSRSDGTLTARNLARALAASESDVQAILDTLDY